MQPADRGVSGLVKASCFQEKHFSKVDSENVLEFCGTRKMGLKNGSILELRVSINFRISRFLGTLAYANSHQVHQETVLNLVNCLSASPHASAGPYYALLQR